MIGILIVLIILMVFGLLWFISRDLYKRGKIGGIELTKGLREIFGKEANKKTNFLKGLSIIGYIVAGIPLAILFVSFITWPHLWSWTVFFVSIGIGIIFNLPLWIYEDLEKREGKNREVKKEKDEGR